MCFYFKPVSKSRIVGTPVNIYKPPIVWELLYFILNLELYNEVTNRLHFNNINSVSERLGKFVVRPRFQLRSTN